MQYLVLCRTVNAYILRRAVIRYLVVECRKLRHFDKVTETLFWAIPIGDIKLEVGCFLCENRQPSVDAPYILPFKLFSGVDT